MRSFYLIVLLVVVGLMTFSCRDSVSNTLFAKKTSGQTGINFENKVTEDEQFNIMTYEYLYNGAGVATGDVNNDGLADIYFTGNMVPNKLFLNKGDLQFEDITTKAGVAGRERWKTGVTMADVNGDGFLDIYVCYSGPGTDEARKNELYINNGIKDGFPTFSEKATEYGLDAAGTFSTQCAFFDMDRDGDLDAFLVNHADMFYNAFFNSTKLRHTRHPKFGNRLYRNDNGKFVDISEQAGIYGSGLNFGLSVSVSDLNNDNWPDLYVTNDYNEQDFLYLNKRNGTFREVLKQSMGHISQFSMGSDIADYNNDLQPDVFTLDMLPEDNKRQKLLKGPDGYDIYTLLVDSGFHHQNMRNMLQLNMGMSDDSIPQFSEIGQLAGISNTDWSWAPLLADFDNDGWKDIYITNGYLRDFTNLDFLKFTYTEAQAKAGEEGRKINTWELIKQLPSTKINNYIFSNNHHLGFSNKTKEWGVDNPTISTGAAYADLDNDGDLDLIVNNSNQPVDIYENNSNRLLQNHFIKIKLTGTGGNTQGIGGKVIVSTDSTEQIKELYTTKGFQSSVEPVLHFGLGNQSSVKSIKVIWPDGKISVQNNTRADTMLNIAYAQAQATIAETSTNPTTLFTDYTMSSGLNYRHIENNSFVDFKSQFLLPYQVSKQGPFLTKGDVNGDGLEDVFVGGNMNQPGQLFLQTSNEKFVAAASQPWVNEKTAKDAGVLLFDADGDKDLDLFIAKGGTEFPTNDPLYQSVLYLNNGKENFTKAINVLPSLLSSSSCVVAADYDKDGDMDLFIGGRSIPGNYPLVATSYLLRNESKGVAVKFEYASEQPEKLLRQPGIVTTATWADINNDSWPDLIVAGEFMPITVFENQKGKLVNKTADYGMNNTGGLWCRVIATDMDNDGDIDLVAGNLGLNTQWRASVEQPLSLCYSDFDNNGSIDPLLCYYIQGKNYPAASLDEMAEQLPVVRKKFLRYEAFSQATLTAMFSEEQLKKAKTLKAPLLTSTYFENLGNGQFKIHALTLAAQFSVLSGIVAEDIDGDGKKDLLLSGNYYPWRVQWGRMDASMGLFCKGDGKGNFAPLQYAQTGLLLQGDIRDMVAVQTSENKSLLIASKNNDKVQVIKMK